jgi:hypothetical protein
MRGVSIGSAVHEGRAKMQPDHGRLRRRASPASIALPGTRATPATGPAPWRAQPVLPLETVAPADPAADCYLFCAAISFLKSSWPSFVRA